MKKNIKKILENALTKLPKFDTSIGNISIDQSVERTKNSNHGDFTTNIAMQIASSSGKNPKEIAENIISEMIDIKGINEIKIAPEIPEKIKGTKGLSIFDTFLLPII